MMANVKFNPKCLQMTPFSFDSFVFCEVYEGEICTDTSGLKYCIYAKYLC